ncbi:MAG: FHA domain-containing protein, partial [Cyanobacteria bacterium P01_C01_bin.72]
MLQINVVNYQTGEFKQKTFQPNSQAKLEWLVGRRADCDLILTSPEISRAHGKFLWKENSYYFIDLGSTDGSKINSQDLDADCYYPIKENDLILIGNFVLAIEKMDAKIASEEPDYSQATISNRFPQWNSEDLQVRCQQIIDETPDVKTFRFVADPPVSFAYEPGQFVSLELEIGGKKVVRSYSISSTPS